MKAVGLWSWARLEAHGVRVHRPEGGFYIFPDFTNFSEAAKTKLGTESSIEFCRILLEQTGVSLLAGGYFNQSDEILTARLAFVDFKGGEILEYLKQNPNAVLDEPFIIKYAPQVYHGINKLCDWLDDLKK